MKLYLVHPSWDIKSRRLMSVMKNKVKQHMDEQDRLAAELEKREKWILSVKKKFAEQRERREKLKEQERCAELAELEFVQRWQS